MSDDRKPWHRLPGENQWAYHAFQHFRNLPPRSRSLDRAYSWCMAACSRDRNVLIGNPADVPAAIPEPLKEASKRWKQWRKQFRWDERTAEYDVHVENEEREEAKAAVKSMKRRHAALAAGFLAKLVARINTIDVNDIGPRDMPRWLKEAATIERLSRDQPTQVIKEQTDGNIDLSKLTDEQLAQWESLVDIVTRKDGEDAHG